MPFKTTLEAALAHLKSKGIIKRDTDILKPLGIKSKGTVSSYATGSIKMSDGFRTKFENYYKLNLDDFKDLVGEDEEQQVQPSTPQQDDFQAKYIESQEETIKLFRELLENKQALDRRLDKIEKDIEEFKRSHESTSEELNALKHSLQVNLAVQLAFQDHWLHHFYSDPKQVAALKKSIEKATVVSLAKMKKESIDKAIGIESVQDSRNNKT